MKDKGLLTYKGNFSRWKLYKKYDVFNFGTQQIIVCKRFSWLVKPKLNYKVLEPLAIKEIKTEGVLDTIWKEIK